MVNSSTACILKDQMGLISQKMAMYYRVLPSVPLFSSFLFGVANKGPKQKPMTRTWTAVC